MNPFGQVKVKITSADCAGVLNAIAQEKIKLKNVIYRDGLTLEATVPDMQYKTLCAVIEKFGASLKMLQKDNFAPKKLLKRPILLAFLCLVFASGIILPSRVLFVSVEGNAQIPDSFILEAAAECGIRFGAQRRQIRSEIMKNRLLEKIPQLQWAGINTYGCNAVISVQEKTVQEESKSNINRICSIVAARDGIIQNCTVLQGNPLCTVGQAVKAGQTLVSGYLDLGLLTKTTQADAEIRALTSRQIEIVTPVSTAVRGEVTEQRTYIALRIGKKLIKLNNYSGNFDTTCGKIYLEKFLCLPGGFTLPIALVTETVSFYAPGQTETASVEYEAWLARFAKTYLQSVMISGEIISGDTQVYSTPDACYFSGKYACNELIGQVRYEQIILRNETNDRTNREF